MYLIEWFWKEFPTTSFLSHPLYIAPSCSFKSQPDISCLLSFIWVQLDTSQSLLLVIMMALQSSLFEVVKCMIIELIYFRIFKVYSKVFTKAKPESLYNYENHKVQISGAINLNQNTTMILKIYNRGAIYVIFHFFVGFLN